MSAEGHAMGVGKAYNMGIHASGVFFLYYRRIRDLREDSDLTQTQIAQAINITQRSYSYYETGTHMIPPWVLSALADFHHTSVDYLLGRTNVRAPYPPPRR